MAEGAQTMTILTVLFQKVIASYEHVIALLARQYYVNHNQSMEHIPTYLRIFDANEDGDEIVMEGSSREEGTELGHFQLREYEVDKFEAPCMFSGLVTLQLRILRAFLVRIKEAPEHFTRDYVGLLDEVDSRAIKLGKFCLCEV
jgi:hypothetical protein